MTFKKQAVVKVLGAMVIIAPSICFSQVPANTLLEVQQLRQEVAQLRDLVERQQYRLNRLEGVSPQQVQNSQPVVQQQTPPPQTTGGIITPAHQQATSVEQVANNRLEQAIANEQSNTIKQGASQAADAQVNQALEQAQVVPETVEAIQAAPAQISAVNVPSTSSVVTSGAKELEHNLYQKAFDLLKQGQYDKASGYFNEQVSVYPNGDLADDAYYWLGESSYINGKAQVAKNYFQRVVDDFKQSPRVPDAMLKLAYIDLEKGNKVDAKVLLQDIIQYHPRSNAAISAKNRLKDLSD